MPSFEAGSGLQAQGSSLPAQQPSFKTVTTLVEVDAIVKDRAGRFVPDLKAADFELREDGVPQQVEQIYLVLGTVVKPVTSASPTTPAVPAPPALPAPSTPLPAPQTQRTFVLLFDQEHMLPGGLDHARKAALEFLKTSFHEGDIGGIVSGGTMVNNRLTSVRAELESAVNGLKPAGDLRSLQATLREWPRLVDSFEVYQIAERNDQDTISRAVSRACNDDPDGCKRVPVDQMVMEKARRVIVDLRSSGMRTMHTVTALASGLAKLPGRKTIIFLSDGFFAEDSWANLRQVVDVANRASVRVYSLDTRGLNRGSASSDIFEMGSHGAVTPAAEVPGFDTASDGPNSLAVDTGGLAIRNENDFAKALDQIAADTSSYYILGYRSTNTKFDGKFRQIAVSVKTSGLTVRARKGYLATPPVASTSAGTAATPGAAVPSNAGTGGPPTAPPVAAPSGAPAAAVAPPAAAAETPAAASAGAGALRLQPDVKDRLAALGKIAPDTSRGSANTVPDNVLAQARAGWEAYQRGDVRAAKAALSAAAAHPATPPWVHYALGWSQYALREYEAAGTSWEHVRGVAPAFEPVYFDLADSYLQQRELGKAIDVLRAAEKRWPNDVEVYNAIGVVQVGRQAFDDAIKTFEKAVEVGPDDATACYNLARTHEMRFIQAQRLTHTAGAVNRIFDDRDLAIEYYRRTIAIGKLFVEEAQRGLTRLGVQ
jgi:VWFA-related protein